MADVAAVDSDSVGGPARFRTLEDLERSLEAVPGTPRDGGRVALLVRRGAGGRRETLDRMVVSPDGGVPGDAWGRRSERNDDMQIAVMQQDVAELIANGQPLTLFGDSLFLDLDLSADHLPPGSRIRIGAALLVVTPMPHDGCRKFRARFGGDALRFVCKPELRHRNLRGIYMRVVDGGEVRTGDAVQVISGARPRVNAAAEDDDASATIIALERAALDRWGRGDPSGFLEISAADVVYFDPFLDRRIDGHDALTRYYDAIRGKVSMSRYELINPHVQQVGHAAVLTFNFASYGGTDDALRWNCTEVFRRSNGRWEIIQTHWSFTEAGRAT